MVGSGQRVQVVSNASCQAVAEDSEGLFGIRGPLATRVVYVMTGVQLS